MGLLVMLGVVAAIVILPFATFAGIAGLAIMIWSWGRIGRYFINLGRWLGHWRDFIPLSILGTLYIGMLLLMLVLLPQVKYLWIVLLILHVIVTVVCLFFAMIAWTVWLCQWFWPGYRRRVWGAVAWIYGQPRRTTPRRLEGGGGERPAKTARGARPAKKRSLAAVLWASLLGKPSQPARLKTEPEGKPGAELPKKKLPVKRSWFGTLWALMLGKPSKRPKPKMETLKVQTTEQTLGPSGSVAAYSKTGATTRVTEPSLTPQAGKKAKVKRSGFGAFWALLLRKPSQTSKTKPASVKDKASEQVVIPSGSYAVGESETTTRAAEAPTAKQPDNVEVPAKKGALERVWTNMVRGATFVLGLLFLGVMWVGQKLREGIELIRERLNLD